MKTCSTIHESRDFDYLQANLALKYVPMYTLSTHWSRASLCRSSIYGVRDINLAKLRHYSTNYSCR